MQSTQLQIYKGFKLIPIKDAGTKELCTIPQLQSLIDYAERYDLDLRRSHACVMYGRPFIEIDGLYWLARKTNEFNGIISEPMTLEEKRKFGWHDDDIAWKSTCYRKGCDQPFTGFHRILLEQKEEVTVRGTDRYPMLRYWADRMCEKQAERFALRKAFPDLPGGEDEYPPSESIVTVQEADAVVNGEGAEAPVPEPAHEEQSLEPRQTEIPL